MLVEKKREEVHRLWDDLADLGASRVDTALECLMQHFARHLKVDNVVWVGAGRIQRGPRAEKDFQKGWRALAVRHLIRTPFNLARGQQGTLEQDTDPSMTSRALAIGAGAFRVHRLYDQGFVDLQAFQRTRHYQVFYQQAGVTDRMFVGFPMNHDAESFFLLDRIGKSKLFSKTDAEYVAYAMRGLKWFHRELMLSHGLLVAQTPLTAMERRLRLETLRVGNHRSILRHRVYLALRRPVYRIRRGSVEPPGAGSGRRQPEDESRAAICRRYSDQ